MGMLTLLMISDATNDHDYGYHDEAGINDANFPTTKRETKTKRDIMMIL